MSTAEQILYQLLISRDIELKAAVCVKSGIRDDFTKWFLLQFDRSQYNGCTLEDFALYFLTELHQIIDTFQLRYSVGDTAKALNESGEEHRKSFTPAHLPNLCQAALNYDEQESVADDAANWSFNSLDRSSSNSFASNTSTPLRRGRRSGAGQQQQHTYTPSSSPGSSDRPRGSGSHCLGDFIPKTDWPIRKSTKKRIVPTTISNRVFSGRGRGVTTARDNRVTMPFGCGNRPFNNENNILMLSGAVEEIESSDQCAVMAARRSLMLDAKEMSKELEQAEEKAAVAGARARNSGDAKALPMVDLTQLGANERESLLRLAYIYALLIKLNLATNVLGEVSLLLNLVNASDESFKMSSPPTASMQTLSLDGLSGSGGDGDSVSLSMGQVLRNAPNCVYFSLQALQLQHNLLALLDVKSLGVILSNQRLNLLAAPLMVFLDDIHKRKQQSEAHFSWQDTVIRFDRFQTLHIEDATLRQHFPSEHEFEAFKRQRDFFTAMLSEWDVNHILSSWQCSVELMPKIREIFRMSEHAVNMAHLAQLFVAQLLITSCDETPPEKIGVEVDSSKFSKLSQRMVEPSKFSVDYQFPRKQAFFHDFVIVARSIAFTEQLKLALYSELHSLNNATYMRMPGLLKSEDVASDKDGVPDAGVDPKTMSCLLILAKFIGFIIEQPFSAGPSELTELVQNKQLMLRNLFPICVNSAALLAEAIEQGKLLVTLPWVVQFLGMLGDVALQLDSTRETTNMLFRLYMSLGVNGADVLQMTPVSAFIVRCCVGWLLDTKPVVVAQFYVYRLQNSPFKAQGRQALPTEESRVEATLVTSPAADAVMNVACPFLAEFRVSIMPPQYASAKCVSRTGRTRYIATRVASAHDQEQKKPTAAEHANALGASAENRTNMLASAFLHAQDASMQNLYEYVINRTYHSFVKDVQRKLLLPSKMAAEVEVNALKGVDFDEVLSSVVSIYGKAKASVLVAWNEEMDQNIDKRIAFCMEGLMPIEGKPIVNDTMQKLMRRSAKIKVIHWRDANVTMAFYCRETADLARRICHVNQNRRPTTYSTQLTIVDGASSVYTLIDELQMWLHTTSRRPDRLSKTESLVAFLRRLPGSFKHLLPTVYYRLIGHGLVHLVQNIIAQCPVLLTPDVVEALCELWSAQQLQAAFEQCAVFEDGIFDHLMAIHFLSSLSARRNCFERLTQLLVALIRNDLITPSFLNELMVTVYKEDWSIQVFNEISRMLRTVAADTRTLKLRSEASDDQLHSLLFMQAIADMAHNLDKF